MNVSDLLKFEYTNWPNQHTTQPAYQLKVKNVFNLGMFQPIWLKLAVETQNGRTQHIYVITKISEC